MRSYWRWAAKVGRKLYGTHFRHVGPSLRDGYRDFIAVIASLGETRPRDITQRECHWAQAIVLRTSMPNWKTVFKPIDRKMPQRERG